MALAADCLHDGLIVSCSVARVNYYLLLSVAIIIGSVFLYTTVVCTLKILCWAQ